MDSGTDPNDDLNYDVAQAHFDQLMPCPFCRRKYDKKGIQSLFCGAKPPVSSVGIYVVRCVYCSVEMTDDRMDKVITNWNMWYNHGDKEHLILKDEKP